MNTQTLNMKVVKAGNNKEHRFVTRMFRQCLIPTFRSKRFAVHRAKNEAGRSRLKIKQCAERKGKGVSP